jgi:pimeloyl-ACP methyl ester carboxylesterase
MYYFLKKRCRHLLAFTVLSGSAFICHAQVALPNKDLVIPSRIAPGIARVATVINTPANAFGRFFNMNETGRNDVNAYLLCYLTTLIYPQYLATVAGDATPEYITRLHNSRSAFEQEYKLYTSRFFNNARYFFFQESFAGGYDPEAMVVSTDDAIFVVFRGTDRVASNKKENPISSFIFDWAEWLLTDFDARQITDPDITGKVHAGFWYSLGYNNFKSQLMNRIVAENGRNKKIWITGHSLGAAHAQLFAMYLRNKSIPVQGVYVYASPHPGTQEFVTAMNQLFPGDRLQRFDFSSDPVTTIAPYTLGYRRAGTRIFYEDIKSMRFRAAERSFTDALALGPALTGSFGFNLAGSQLCYHHPTWYLRAAYEQLTKEERNRVPVPLPLPHPDNNVNDYSAACDILARNKGINASAPGSMIEEGVAAVGEAIEKIRFAAASILENITGTALTNGYYYISSHASGDKLYLNDKNGIANGKDVQLNRTRHRLYIQRFGTIGYSLRFGVNDSKDVVLDSEMSDLFDDGASNILLWERNNVPGVSANQRWLLIRLRNNKYLIKNLANGKVLDANNGCTQNETCGVKTWRPVTDDQTQIWTIEPAN